MEVKAFIGTSGWYYDWNKDKSLDWFIAHSGLDAVELNMSFYRFPSSDQVRSWAEKAETLHWAIKVHRAITHSHKLNEEGFRTWERFSDAFDPLDPQVDFYLFQMPPKFSNFNRMAEFAEATGLGERFALELQRPSARRTPKRRTYSSTTTTRCSKTHA
ncbi:MAG: DUF72 domain-containing protein [Methanomicrobiaceae archaeon]|nr:DUF72 domain-containing protein [Methanomicrobiaceae archaeon]